MDFFQTVLKTCTVSWGLRICVYFWKWLRNEGIDRGRTHVRTHTNSFALISVCLSRTCSNMLLELLTSHPRRARERPPKGAILRVLTNKVIGHSSHPLLRHDNPNYNQIATSRCNGHSNKKNCPDNFSPPWKYIECFLSWKLSKKTTCSKCWKLLLVSIIILT